MNDKMAIVKLFNAPCFAGHMVIETLQGNFKIFSIFPIRKIKETDLTIVPYWKPVGENGREAETYMYKLYGFEAV